MRRGTASVRGNGRVRTSGRTSWWKRLFIVLAVCGVIMIVMTVIGGIVSLLALL